MKYIYIYISFFYFIGTLDENEIQILLQKFSNKFVDGEHPFSLAEPLIQNLSTSQLEYVYQHFLFFFQIFFPIRKRKETATRKLEEELNKMLNKGIPEEEARDSLSILGGHPSAYRAEELLAVAFCKVCFNYNF